MKFFQCRSGSVAAFVGFTIFGAGACGAPFESDAQPFSHAASTSTGAASTSAAGSGGTNAATSATTAASGATGAGGSMAPPNPENMAPLRLLTGDGTTITPDWSATESGSSYVYTPVIEGSPSEPWISSAHYVGAHSIAFQVPDDLSGQKERVEYEIALATDPDGLHFDNARYSGFAFKVGSSPAPFTGTAIFYQCWQGSPWGPPVSLKFSSDASAPFHVRLAIRNMATGPDSAVPDLELWSGDVIQPDTWYSFVIYVQPRYDGDGNIKLWIDGTERVDWTGPIGYDPAQVAGAYAGLDIKNGVYQPSSNNGHTFYFDQIKVAIDYAAAVP